MQRKLHGLAPEKITVMSQTNGQVFVEYDSETNQLKISFLKKWEDLSKRYENLNVKLNVVYDKDLSSYNDFGKVRDIEIDSIYTRKLQRKVTIGKAIKWKVSIIDETGLIKASTAYFKIDTGSSSSILEIQNYDGPDSTVQPWFIRIEKNSKALAYVDKTCEILTDKALKTNPSFKNLFFYIALKEIMLKVLMNNIVDKQNDNNECEYGAALFKEMSKYQKLDPLDINDLVQIDDVELDKWYAWIDDAIKGFISSKKGKSHKLINKLLSEIEESNNNVSNNER